MYVPRQRCFVHARYENSCDESEGMGSVAREDKSPESQREDHLKHRRKFCDEWETRNSSVRVGTEAEAGPVAEGVGKKGQHVPREKTTLSLVKNARTVDG